MMTGIIAGGRVSTSVVAVTWDPTTAGEAVLSNGNLTATSSGASSLSANVRSTISVSGKRYFEVKILQIGSGFQPGVGISNDGNPASSGDGEFGGGANNIELRADGTVYKAGSLSAAIMTPWAVNDIIMVAFNAGGQRLWFGKNGTWIGNPAAGTGASSTNNVSNPTYAAACCGPMGSEGALTAYFTGFNYTIPAGFAAF